jgi:hypothetical protein
MLCEVRAGSHYAAFTNLRSASVCTISNESHCKIGAKRVIRKLCFALNQHEMRNVAQYGFSMREPCGLSTNSNPSFVPHWPNVTHLLGIATTSVSNGTCVAMDQSLSYEPLRTGGLGLMGEYARMLGFERQSSARSMTGVT